MLAREEPIEKSGASAPDVQIAGGRRGKSHAHVAGVVDGFSHNWRSRLTAMFQFSEKGNGQSNEAWWRAVMGSRKVIPGLGGASELYANVVHHWKGGEGYDSN